VGPGRKRGSIDLIQAARWRRCVRRLFALLLTLLSLLGCVVLLLMVEQGRVRSVMSPRTQAEQPSHPPADARRAERDAGSTHGGTGEKAGAALLSSKEETCDDERVLVDRSHRLPADYVPEDLVSLPDNGVPTLGGRELLLRREAAEHLGALISAAAADGEELVVASAFRSYEDQRLSYGRLKSIYGAGADSMSATPGHSQHQLGTAVDFTNAATAYQVKRRFGYTSASWWLRDHAPEHGFVLAYPPGGDESGYGWEPWHYRYVGVENAERLERSGLTLQGFLVREGVMPHC
jgi:D-alanyl-D-alanine carboxypeptidase